MSDAEKTRRALRRRVRAEERLLLVVAGPNGAGKSTFVETFLKPTGILVVNPDEVATGLSPDAPEAIAYEAARVADTWRRDLVARGVSFCMETVFSRVSGFGPFGACRADSDRFDANELTRARPPW